VPEEAASFVEQHQQKQIILDKYRGQTQYECVVQAADYFLRQEIGNSSPTDLRYMQHQNGDGSTWRVEFAEKNGSLYEVKLSSETFIPDNLIGSCGRTQSKPITQFTYLNHAAVS
jgi:hypothetical protein